MSDNSWAFFLVISLSRSLFSLARFLSLINNLRIQCVHCELWWAVFFTFSVIVYLHRIRMVCVVCAFFSTHLRNMFLFLVVTYMCISAWRKVLALKKERTDATYTHWINKSYQTDKIFVCLCVLHWFICQTEIHMVSKMVILKTVQVNKRRVRFLYIVRTWRKKTTEKRIIHTEN